MAADAAIIGLAEDGNAVAATENKKEMNYKPFINPRELYFVTVNHVHKLSLRSTDFFNLSHRCKFTIEFCQKVPPDILVLPVEVLAIAARCADDG